ncbi:helix-turn-helix transcriptional regulator [Bifidobacterium sp. ESL0775]|uniref:helix-turn-helix domain-containing protein n=1 Tax=Bifidobacterium sp. ESL0775 TaxID=2983230 RepID=UPI0023F99AA4|nr:helix-turn-helix transcriptional regulator [Bifidobacterium sp. ESL0775]WEV69476.1 helix-turn-helix transcriptional regulator [Bifidobacterium sp. ESL0775]
MIKDIYDDQLIGSNVSRLREEAGMTMEMLAAKMRDKGSKWTNVTVSKIEKGERTLKYPEAMRVLECLDKDPINDSSQLIATSPDVTIRAAMRRVDDKNSVLESDISALQKSIEKLRQTVGEERDARQKTIDEAQRLINKTQEQIRSIRGAVID